jgi:hypothetical protein
MQNAVAENVGLSGAASPVGNGSNTGTRKRTEEEPHDTYRELWDRYMEAEQGELGQRQNGQLGRALSGESQEDLDRIAEEDQRRAREGLVELRSGDGVWFLRIDELARENRPARIESENARGAWIQKRLGR